MHFTYSRWDGTQALDDLDVEVLFDALADEVLQDGDVDAALSRLSWAGVDGSRDDAFLGGRNLVDAFVQERERFRHAHRSGSAGDRPRAPAALDELERSIVIQSRTELASERAGFDDLDAEQPMPAPANRPLRHQTEGGDECDADVFGSPGPSSGEQAPSSSHAGNGQHLGSALAGAGTRAELDSRDATGVRGTGEERMPALVAEGDDVTGVLDLDSLESELLRACRSGNLDAIDAAHFERVLGQGARELLARLQGIPDALVRAGYLRRTVDQFDLSGRGLRRIGQKALDDIFRSLQSRVPGDHPVPGTAVNGAIADGHKPFDADDDFRLDLNRTLLNAIVRTGPVRPVALSVNDFEVVRTDRQTQAYTVLMLDVSPSMTLRGCLAAGRKVALAMNALIQKRFPRDRLYLVAFSGYARLVPVDAIHRLRPREREYGTNMHHGFAVARRLLARHRGSRQIVLITDGEPTAHLDGERAHFSYPPTLRTRTETLREVRRCTRDDIVINTFMLDGSQGLADFVDEVTRINRGRSFFTTPDHLGEYVITDYVRGRVRR